MTRQNRQEGASDNSDLVGYWQGGGDSLQISKDGTLTYAGQIFLYTVQQNVLTIVPLTNAIQLPYQQLGDTLTVVVNGQRQVLTRQPQSGQGSATSKAYDDLVRSVFSSGLKSNSTAPSSNPEMSALAGVWVGEEASLDPSFYMSYTSYLILYPDGSVGFDKTEGGATRSQVSASMERFSYFSSGRTGNKEVCGQWESDGHSILIHWRNNTTWQGQVDPMSGKILMFGVGVINEGSNVMFDRQ